MANLVLFKTSEQVYSHIHDDILYDYWQVKIPIKLLSFFAHSLYIKNFEFLQHFNDKFLLVIEAWAGKKINWKKIELLTVGEFAIYKNIENDLLTYAVYIQMNGIRGVVMWYVNKSNFEIDLFSSSHFEEDLTILWFPDEYDEDIRNEFPENVEKISKLKFKSKLKFSVYSWLDTLPHEGKFAISLEDINDKEKVSEVLGYGLGRWNTQTDQARQTGDSALDKGYCHTVSFDGIEENIAYWYIDAGSAHEGIHEFLLKELSDSGIKIKSVEIQML